MNSVKRENKSIGHLCAMDCRLVPYCPWARTKNKSEELIADSGIDWLDVEKSYVLDFGKYKACYRVVRCDKYECDPRSGLAPKQVHTSNRWSSEEDKLLLSYIGQYTYSRIAELLGRTCDAVVKRGAMLKKMQNEK